MAKAVANYSLDTDLIESIKQRANDSKVPASRLVNGILAAHFRTGKTKA